MPEISVIIPTYNCAKYVSKAVKSVLEQTYKDYEIIVIDDGSTDQTKEIIMPYLKYKDVHYIYQKNKGLAVARNTGIYNSKGKYIALLDADDYWVSIKLEKQMKIFEKKSDITLVHSNVYLYFEQDEAKTEKYSRNIDYNQFTQRELFEKILLWQADIFVPTILIKKDVFNKIGYFDEKLTYLGCEDREFCLRLFREYKTYFLKDYLAYYMVRKNSMSKDKGKMQRARKYVLEKTLSETNFLKNKKRVREKAYSNLYFRLGRGFYLDGKCMKGLKMFTISIYYNCFNFKAYLFVLICFIPIKIIRNLKNKWRKYVENCKAS